MMNFYEYHRDRLDMFDLYFLPISLYNPYKPTYHQARIGNMSSRNHEISKIEHIIKKTPSQGYHYACTILDRRWPEAEPWIMRSPYYAYCYAADVIKERWYEAEPIIRIDDLAWRCYCVHFDIYD